MTARRSLITLLPLILLSAGAILILTPRPAAADFSDREVSELVTYVNSRAALNLRLMALDALRKKTGTAVDGELFDIAKGEDLRTAIFATTALGKRKTPTSKAKLKSLLETGSLKKDVRMAAMTAIAVHFKDSRDLSYLKSKTSSNAALKAHLSWLTTKVYRRRS